MKTGRKAKWITAIPFVVSLSLGCGPSADEGSPQRSEEASPHDVGQLSTELNGLDDFNDKYIGEDQKKFLRLASDAAAMYTNITSTINTINSIATLLGLVETEQSLQEIILKEFQQVNRKLDGIFLGLIGLDWSTRSRDTEIQLADALTASESATDWIRYNGRAMPTLEADAELQASGRAAKALMGSGFFQRVHHENANDGPDTVTDRTVMKAEWKRAISRRPATSNGLVFEWRLGLPALMHALSARLTVLSAVYPDHVQAGRFRQELLSYRTRLLEIMKTIDDQIDCGWSLWKVSGPIASYTLKAICADPYTGISYSAERTGVLKDYMSHPSIIPQNPYAIRGPGTSTDPGLLLGTTGCPTGHSAEHYLCRAFWDLAANDPVFGDLVKNGFDDAKARLRNKLGLFEVRKMADTLYALAYNSLRPDAGSRVRSAYANRCLDAQQGQLFMAMPLVIATCASTTPSPYAAVTGQNFSYRRPEDKLSSGGLCADVQWASTHRGTPVWFWPCNGGDAQRWSYDPQSHRFRNALGRVLDVQWGNSASGTPVWTWDDTGGAAQYWAPDPAWSAAPGTQFPIAGL